MQLPITFTIICVFKINGTQRSSLNIWVSEAKSSFSDFLQLNPNYERYKEDFTRRVIVLEIAALGT